jgi:hypothetical protein
VGRLGAALKHKIIEIDRQQRRRLADPGLPRIGRICPDILGRDDILPAVVLKVPVEADGFAGPNDSSMISASGSIRWRQRAGGRGGAIVSTSALLGAGLLRSARAS